MSLRREEVGRYNTSLFTKFVMALSGLALVGFLVTHLAANLLLYIPNGEAFNQYAHALKSWGLLLYVAEVGLLVLFLLHAFTAIRLKVGHKSARPVRYKIHKTKGKPSKWNIASGSMILTGMVLLVFLFLHVRHFRFGPSTADGYAKMIQGVEMRDLHRLVIETFQSPIYTFSYVGVMILLGLHLRHGFWSAFQSLGLKHSRWSQCLNQLAIFIAFVFAAGFLFIPIWIYFDLPGAYDGFGR